MKEWFDMIVYAVAYNLMGILFFSVSLLFARKGKRSWHWFWIGVFVQGYSIFGAVLGILKEPETWRNPGNFMAIGLFILLVLIFLPLLKHAHRNVPDKF